MLSSDKNVATIVELVAELKTYFELKKDYLKVDLVEKVVKLVTALAVAVTLLIITVAVLVGGFFLLAKAVNVLGIGTSYAVFTGIGIVGTAIEGVLLLDEGMSALKLISLVLLCGGIIGLKKEEK